MSTMFHMRNNIIGRKVRLARQDRTPPLTQEALATALQLEGWDISRSGIAKIELGMRQVTDVEVARLARALDVRIQWLFECSDEG
jgi:transcriptional regulator with XRE-family HTH domain